MAPNPLRGMRTPRVSSRVAPAPERSGGSRARGRHPSEGGRTTHPRNLKGVAASPHSLPWHQVQVPQGPKVSERSELAPRGRGGSVTGEKGQRPAAGPSCASLLHSRPPQSTTPSRGPISRSPTPHHAPPAGLCPRPSKAGGSLQPVPLRAAEHSAPGSGGAAGHVTAPAGSPITCSEVRTTSGFSLYLRFRPCQLRGVAPREARGTLEPLA